jgi:hypothetical protein
MDISQEYIKMCNCPEIQKNYNIPKAGDFICVGEIGIEIVLDYAYLTKEDFSEDKTINHDGDELKVYVDTDMILGFIKDEFIWLPRQDQLQEMINPKDSSNATYNALMYCKEQIDKKFMIPESMEQVLLWYLMYSKYNKTWDGDKWSS